MNQGKQDVFLVKHDAQGNFQWHWQWGRDGSDQASGVAADHNGNAYVVGYSMDTETNITYGFLALINSSGRCCWMKKFPVLFRAECKDVCRDRDGNLYVTGFTRGDNATNPVSFLSKFRGNGTLVWTAILGDPSGSSSVEAYGVACDDQQSVYVVGSRGDQLAEPLPGNTEDAFLARFDKHCGRQNMLKLWNGGPTDYARGVTVGRDGSVYVAGGTWLTENESTELIEAGPGPESLSPSTVDQPASFLLKYDRCGILQWPQVFRGQNHATRVAVDRQNRVYVAGYGFVAVHDHATGERRYQEPTPYWNAALALDHNANPIIAGSVNGPLHGERHQGGYDGYVSKYVVRSEVQDCFPVTLPKK